MSIQLNYAHASCRQSDIVIPTHAQCWVLPRNGELVKLLLEKQSLRAADLCFSSTQQCHGFIRQLFLMALEDECKTQRPSLLAELGRAMIKNPPCINQHKI